MRCNKKLKETPAISRTAYSHIIRQSSFIPWIYHPWIPLTATPHPVPLKAQHFPHSRPAPSNHALWRTRHHRFNLLFSRTFLHHRHQRWGPRVRSLEEVPVCRLNFVLDLYVRAEWPISILSTSCLRILL